MKKEDNSTSLKLSMGSVASNPLSDKALFGKENKRLYKIILTLLILDFALNILIFINDCNIISAFFDDKKEAKVGFFFLYTTSCIIIFGTLLLFLYLNKLLLSKISRFFYLIVGILYYVYQIIIKLLGFAKDDFSLDVFDIIFFITVALTIIPRIVGFLYIRVYERTIIKLYGAKIAEEHEMFLEKVVDKFDRSTISNIKENQMEKEVEKNIGEDEEIIFTMNNGKVITDKKPVNNHKKIKMKNMPNQEEEVEEEEVADLS